MHLVRTLPVRSVVLVAALAVGLGAHASQAHAGHPHFNDQGTLVWYRTLPEAQAAARASGKLIFIESGRRQCGSCRKLVERLLPQEPIRARLAAVAVGVADDCDVSGTAAMAVLNRNLPGAQFLPLVGFVTPDLVWIGGWCGGTTAENVLAQLQRAEAVHARLRAASPEARAPQAGPVARTAPSRGPSSPPVAAAPLASATPSPKPPPAKAPTSTASPTPRVAVPAPVPTPAPIASRSAPAPVVPATPSPTRVVARSQPRPPTPSASAPIARSAPPAPTPSAPVSGSASGKDLVTRARTCATGGDWGGVLHCYDEAGDGRDPAALAAIAPLAERAHLWALRQIDDAEKAARSRDYPDAMRCLGLIQRSLEGTSCPVAVDAERGQRAVERLMAIEQGSPDRSDEPEALRRRSYQEFRGSRWAPLFRSTPRG